MDGTDVITGLAGLAGVAGLTYLTLREQERLAAEEARHAATGWSFDELARELTYSYDRWHDGSLVIQPVLGIRALNEAYRTTRTSRDELVFEGLWREPARVTTTTTTTWTIEPLLRSADLDADGTVTLAEVGTLLRRFDTDGDGRISRLERAAVYGAYGEVQVEQRSRVTDVDVRRSRHRGRHRADDLTG